MNITISNLKDFERKKEIFKKQGKNKIHIISDFDRTLTKAFVNGMRSSTIIAQIRNGNYLTKDYAPKAHALFNKYNPIEINPKIPLIEKKKIMEEWWRKHFELLIGCGFNKKVINKIIKERKLKFRKGFFEFLDILNKNNIPLIIMSAGPGDMIKEYLKEQGQLYENIHIIANMLNFNKNGKAISVKSPIIHTFNKSEITLKSLEIYHELLIRKNVILLGDSLGDLGMIKGFPYENLISIGFLNYNIDENIEEYKKNFDVVILNDSEMEFVDNLIREIMNY